MYEKHLKKVATKTGWGVITDVDIPANVPICEMTGDVLSLAELKDPNHPAILQINVDTFLSPSGEIDDFFNHSCNPNCKLHLVGKRAFLYSMYVIKAGAELTFDYSTSSTDTLDIWKMDCKCGYIKCRKVISGFQYLDEDIKEEYKKKGMIPLFISDPRFSGR